MSITVEKRQAYSEVIEIINQLHSEYSSKIPQKVKDFFLKERDVNYTKKISIEIPFEQQELKRDTIVILTMLNLKYWCNEKEKMELKRIYEFNEIEYQNSLKEKYNIDNIFKKSELIDEKVHLPDKSIKPTVLNRIINFIKRILLNKRNGEDNE